MLVTFSTLIDSRLQKRLSLREKEFQSLVSLKSILLSTYTPSLLFSSSIYHFHLKKYADPTGTQYDMAEWYRTPLQADDTRHDMGLVDDLIAQCQRIVAEVSST